MTEKFTSYAVDNALAAIADLKEYCEKKAGFEAEISTLQYPVEIILKPTAEQLDLLDGDAKSYFNGDGNIVIVAGIEIKLASTLQFKMPADVLKKILSKSAKVATLYRNAFRAAAQGLLDTGDATAIRSLQERL